MIQALRQSWKRRELREKFPQEPWKWSPEWAEGLGEPSGAQVSGVVPFVGVFFLLTSFVVYEPMLRELERGRQAAILFMVFPAIGVLKLVSWVRSFLAGRKYGRRELKLERVPVSLGAPFKATFQVSHPLRSTAGLAVVLSCNRQYTSGSGKNRSTRVEVKWQERWSAPITSLGHGAIAELAIEIPYDLPPTDSSHPRDEIHWDLEVSSEEPGLDLAAAFRIPVFRTPESDPRRTQEAMSRERAKETAQNALPASSYTIRHTPRGEEYRIRRGGASLAGTALLAIGSTFVVVGFLGPLLSGTDGAVGAFRVLFFSVFGLCGLASTLIGLGEVLGSSSVLVEHDRFVLRRTYLGLGLSRAIEKRAVRRLELMSEVRSGTRIWYDIRFHAEGTRPVTLAARIADKREAELLMSELERRISA
ncbi:MAG TPA: hypothetical protein VM598_11900 [Bdellovibrionota bacterium]|nr:hypothetical protein [Bdellovibrionota bacterium]